MSAIWRALHAARDCEHTAVTLHQWDDDWPAFVRHVIDTGPFPRSLLNVRIVAYSWGVGHGAVTLARLLQAQGVDVNHLVSCDGVHRPRWLRWRALWSPLLGEPRIVLPANVKIVDFLRQKTNLPHGHLFTTSNGTVVNDHGILKGRTHADMDNSREFYHLVMRSFE